MTKVANQFKQNMDDSEINRTRRVLEFSGKRKDFLMWSRKFMAMARTNGLEEALLGKLKEEDEEVTTTREESKEEENNEKEEEEAENEEDEEESNEEEDNEQESVKHKLARAYRDLLLCMTEEISFGIVESARSRRCPESDPALAWSKLNKKYCATTPANQVMLKQKFHNSRLGNATVDPDAWINSLEEIKQDLANAGVPMTEQDLMIHILSFLPTEYSITVELAESRLGDPKDPLTLDQLREMLNNKFQQMNAKEESGQENETALMAQQGPKPFKGICYKCGKYGHKGADCRSGNNFRNNNNYNQNNYANGPRKRFNGICNYCGICGHKEVD